MTDRMPASSQVEYEPWSRKTDREALARRWDVSPDEVLVVIEEQGYTPYLPLSEADVAEISDASRDGNELSRTWKKAVKLSRRRANHRCKGELSLVELARQDYFSRSDPPFPSAPAKAREWLGKRFKGAGPLAQMDTEDGLTPIDEDMLTPDWLEAEARKPILSPRKLPEGTEERFRAWVDLVSASAAVTPFQATSYLLTGDVCAAEPPIRVIVIEKVGRMPVIQITADSNAPPGLVHRAYAAVARLTTGRQRVRLGAKEASAWPWPTVAGNGGSHEQAEATLAWMESIAEQVGGPVSIPVDRLIPGVPTVRYVVRCWVGSSYPDHKPS